YRRFHRSEGNAKLGRYFMADTVKFRLCQLEIADPDRVNLLRGGLEGFAEDTGLGNARLLGRFRPRLGSPRGGARGGMFVSGMRALGGHRSGGRGRGLVGAELPLILLAGS